MVLNHMGNATPECYVLLCTLNATLVPIEALQSLCNGSPTFRGGSPQLFGCTQRLPRYSKIVAAGFTEVANGRTACDELASPQTRSSRTHENADPSPLAALLVGHVERLRSAPRALPAARLDALERSEPTGLRTRLAPKLERSLRRYAMAMPSTPEVSC